MLIRFAMVLFRRSQKLNGGGLRFGHERKLFDMVGMEVGSEIHIS